MNVTVRALAGELARAGIESDLYTRATSPDDPPVVEVEPGVRVLHLPAGPLEPIPKQHLPRYLCAFLCSLLRAGERHGPYDVLHSHYWVSGWVARLARERWDSPVVHSFHTLGRVKNLSLADGDLPEPPTRLAGEERVVAAADSLLAPTPAEARQLVDCTAPPRPRSRSCPTASTGAASTRATRPRPGRPSGSPTATCSPSSAASSRSRPPTWPC
jgi:D-inositol-3-phosphate glycosyltransferase